MAVHHGGKEATDGILNSVQGYDLDNQGNIYISSQKSPDLEKKSIIIRRF
ncbi:helveticin J family class III bacteriocin [Lactobacillus kefiranofaciens]|uniref:Helveticin J family class III bacteriocin n=1 Tax=Lactobacillus kefiranofaciens TaxID=267818 RepID=A0AAX3UC57_9LACO|nr:helveticin J family class III bacteriocin [Lactobacillus kefiranofaciens]AEG41314.1 hypothetical protein WANG_1619 [Lactobacillus kefiranofaciens subsp. kefiranofaciens]WGO85256.1 helveticin J family class III bacteriocin [Lactobacillus kefiranofaciens]WQH35465.1 helveticin J family class III bacteriocin [Lactobacillus kefiranofaciens]